MRVIAGKARRLSLKTIEGNDTRPTTDRIKETLFNIINSDVYESVFLDLFSGSGAIGIEALSRGAKKAYFVERNKKAIKCIEDNLNFTKLSPEAVIINNDVVSALKIFEKQKLVFDIIFMDPPYNQSHEKNVLEQLSESVIINKDTLIIVEASLETDFDYIKSLGFDIIKEKVYKTNKHIFIKMRGDK